MRKVKIYAARGMTGRNKADVVKEAVDDKAWLEAAGFEVLCPVAKEGVKAEDKPLTSTVEQMNGFWYADKKMIRESDVIFDMTPLLKSEGVAHELGYGRYHCHKPIIRVFPPGKLPPPSSIAHYEDDVVVDSIIQAVEWVYRAYLTPWDRLKWKMKIANKSLIGLLIIRLKWFLDWI